MRDRATIEEYVEDEWNEPKFSFCEHQDAFSTGTCIEHTVENWDRTGLECRTVAHVPHYKPKLEMWTIKADRLHMVEAAK